MAKRKIQKTSKHLQAVCTSTPAGQQVCRLHNSPDPPPSTSSSGTDTQLSVPHLTAVIVLLLARIKCSTSSYWSDIIVCSGRLVHVCNQSCTAKISLVSEHDHG